MSEFAKAYLPIGADLRIDVQRLVMPVTMFVFVASVVAGGGTKPGFSSDALLQLLSVPMLGIVVLALGRCASQAGDVPGRPSLLVYLLPVALLIVPALQLLPMPLALWSALPGRAVVSEALLDAAQPLAWMPLSVSPDLTWTALLSLVPPLVVFWGVAMLSYTQRRRLIGVLLALAMLSALVGFLQVIQGPNSPLRFFEVTNPKEAVGFFANRNHLAALLYCSTAFVFALLIGTVEQISAGRRKDDGRQWLRFVSISLMLFVLLTAQLFARSRAGIALTMASLVVLTIMLRGVGFGQTPDTAVEARRNASRLLFVGVALAILLAIQFGFFRVLTTFEKDPLEDARWPIALATMSVAWKFFPFGTGQGTFLPVFGAFEPLENIIAGTYVNRAHNDWVELSLEGGVLAIAVAACAGLWLLGLIWRSWRPTEAVKPYDLSLARTAGLCIVLLATHSVVDYPLRTGAMMAVMALCCAMLVPPLAPAPAEGRGEHRDLRRMRRRGGRSRQS